MLFWSSFRSMIIWKLLKSFIHKICFSTFHCSKGGELAGDFSNLGFNWGNECTMPAMVFLETPNLASLGTAQIRLASCWNAIEILYFNFNWKFSWFNFVNLRLLFDIYFHFVYFPFKHKFITSEISWRDRCMYATYCICIFIMKIKFGNLIKLNVKSA